MNLFIFWENDAILWQNGVGTEGSFSFYLSYLICLFIYSSRFIIEHTCIYPCILEREWEKELDEELQSFEVVGSANNESQWKNHAEDVDSDDLPDLK